MKKTIPILLSASIVTGLFLIFAFRSQDAGVSSEESYNDGTTVEVYYFHFSRRCVTCIEVENKSKEALIALYPKEFSEGRVTFASVNLEEAGSKSLAERVKVTGQTLLVLNGNQRHDLTAEGFMYATNNFDKFKSEVQAVMDPLVRALK